jgi:hypothetical protein
MNLSLRPALVAALATFLRGRLADMSDAVGSVGTVVVGASAPFATTGYSRARLVRQMYASRLLNADEPIVPRRQLCDVPAQRTV